MASNQTQARVVEEYLAKEFKGKRSNKRPDLLLMQDVHGHCLLVEFKRPSDALTRDHELQAVKYRDDLSRYFHGTRFEVLVIGGQIAKDISVHYSSSDLRMLSFAQVVGRARQRLDWTIKELVHADKPDVPAA
jgi:hypothetical protein